MRKYIYFLFIGILLLNSCSTGLKSLQQGNYYDAIMKAVSRLSSDSDNRKASQVIREGYPMAVTYYQEEIDKVIYSYVDRTERGSAANLAELVKNKSQMIQIEMEGVKE